MKLQAYKLILSSASEMKLFKLETPQVSKCAKLQCTLLNSGEICPTIPNGICLQLDRFVDNYLSTHTGCLFKVAYTCCWLTGTAEFPAIVSRPAFRGSVPFFACHTADYNSSDAKNVSKQDISMAGNLTAGACCRVQYLPISFHSIH